MRDETADRYEVKLARMYDKNQELTKQLEKINKTLQDNNIKMETLERNLGRVIVEKGTADQDVKTLEGQLKQAEIKLLNAEMRLESLEGGG